MGEGIQPSYFAPTFQVEVTKLIHVARFSAGQFSLMAEHLVGAKSRVPEDRVASRLRCFVALGSPGSAIELERAATELECTLLDRAGWCPESLLQREVVGHGGLVGKWPEDRPRWGTYSVKAHQELERVIPDLLMYDVLVFSEPRL